MDKAYVDTVRLMLDRFGLTPEIVSCFVGYIAGHNRPVHEVLFSRDQNLEQSFADEFEGMARVPGTISELEETRKQLRRTLLCALTSQHKQFLLGLVSGSAPWELMPCQHLASLPAIQWKVQNLERLRRMNPAKFKQQRDALAERFDRSS